MKKALYGKYSPELRKFVLSQHAAGIPVKRIFTDVMGRWPDCGMRSVQSISMMVGANSKGGHKVLRTPSDEPRSIPDSKASSISLAGPKWSRQAVR